MYQIFKRLMDFLVALFFIILLCPFILILTILLFIANKGKPFFLHRRPGKNEKNIHPVQVQDHEREPQRQGWQLYT